MNAPPDRSSQSFAATIARVLIWMILLALPVAFFFGDPGAALPPGPMTRLYDAGVQIFGVEFAKAISCGSWLAMELVLLRWFVSGSREE